MVLGAEVEVVEGSQDRDVILYVLVVGYLLETAVLGAQQVDDHLVALLPPQRAVDDQDRPDLQPVLVDVLQPQSLQHSLPHLESMLVQLPAGEGHRVGEHGAVLVDGDVVGDLLEGQSVGRLVLPDHYQDYLLLPVHEFLQRCDVEDDLVGFYRLL